jgi:hypothetical protein
VRLQGREGADGMEWVGEMMDGWVIQWDIPLRPTYLALRVLTGQIKVGGVSERVCRFTAGQDSVHPGLYHGQSSNSIHLRHWTPSSLGFLFP